MKIEMVVPALAAAGMETVVARLTHGFSSRGHDVGVTCIQGLGPIADDLVQAGHRVTLVPTPGLHTLVFPLRLRDWFLERKPDVIHIHSGAWLKAANAARAARVSRILFTMHGIDGTLPWYDRLLDRIAASRTEVVVAVTPALVPYLTESAKVPPRRLHVVMNGIDVRTFQPGPRSARVRSVLGTSPSEVIIGHVARFMPVKNHMLLVNAMARVARMRSNCRLALIGDGVLRPQVEREVAQLGIEDRVAFLGHLTDLPGVYRDLDIAVLSSVSEATSISILEAMASGVPVVATAVGGTPELLAYGQAGLLVPSEDADALAEALVRLVDSVDERRRLGQLARERAVALFSEDAMLDAYEELYSGPGGNAQPSFTV